MKTWSEILLIELFLLILPNGMFKKSSWSKYLSSVHKPRETILCFTSVLLRFLSEYSKEKNIPFSNLFKRILSASLRCHDIILSMEKSFSIIKK